jgi:hypothetical protein
MQPSPPRPAFTNTVVRSANTAGAARLGYWVGAGSTLM